MTDAAHDYWERRRAKLSVMPVGRDEIDTRFRRELEALAHQMAEYCHPYEDPLVTVAYAIARALNLPNWPAAHAEVEALGEAALAGAKVAAEVMGSLRRPAPASAQVAEDAARLDWLASAPVGHVRLYPGGSTAKRIYWSADYSESARTEFGDFTGPTLRSAIDAARAQQGGAA